MKKYIAYAAAIALALPVSFALPTPANANHLTNLCKAIIDNGGDADFGLDFGTFHFNNLGECVSFLNTKDGSQVSICKGVKALGLLGTPTFPKNFGDCMKNFDLSEF